MALDDSQVRRALGEAVRHLERMQQELRAVDNGVHRLGSAFSNDRRFSSDASRLKDELRQVERDLQRAKDRFRTLSRNAR